MEFRRYSFLNDKNDTMSFDFEGYLSSNCEFILTDYSVFLFNDTIGNFEELKTTICKRYYLNNFGKNILAAHLKEQTSTTIKVIS